MAPLVVLGQTGKPLYNFNGKIEINTKSYDISPESRLAHALFFAAMDSRGIPDEETGYPKEPIKYFYISPLAYFDARAKVRATSESESDEESFDNGESQGERHEQARRRHAFGQEFAWWNERRAMAMADPAKFS